MRERLAGKRPAPQVETSLAEVFGEALVFLRIVRHVLHSLDRIGDLTTCDVRRKAEVARAE